MQSSAFSYNFQFLLVSLTSPSSCLRLLSRLPVTSIFPSITCFKRQFIHQMWPIQLAFLLFIVCRLFLSSLAVCSTSQFQINRHSERRNLIIHEHNDTYPCFMLKRIGRKVFHIIGPHFQTSYWEMTFLWLKSSYSLHLSREVLSHSYTFALFWLFATPKVLQLAARKCQRFTCTVMACD